MSPLTQSCYFMGMKWAYLEEITPSSTEVLEIPEWAYEAVVWDIPRMSEGKIHHLISLLAGPIFSCYVPPFERESSLLCFVLAAKESIERLLEHDRIVVANQEGAWIAEDRFARITTNTLQKEIQQSIASNPAHRRQYQVLRIDFSRIQKARFKQTEEKLSEYMFQQGMRFIPFSNHNRTYICDPNMGYFPVFCGQVLRECTPEQYGAFIEEMMGYPCVGFVDGNGKGAMNVWLTDANAQNRLLQMHQKIVYDSQGAWVPCAGSKGRQARAIQEFLQRTKTIEHLPRRPAVFEHKHWNYNTLYKIFSATISSSEQGKR